VTGGAGGDLLNAMRSVVAAEQAAERAALKERQKKEREEWRREYPAYPDFEEWLRIQRKPDLARSWRYRSRWRWPTIEGIEHGQERGSEQPTPRDIRDFRAEVVGSQVHYIRRDGGYEASFIDKGKQIDVVDWKSEASVLAAMQLAAQKWRGQVLVTGPDEYKALCVRLAVQHGIQIVNPELQDLVQQERERLRQERVQQYGHQGQPGRSPQEHEHEHEQPAQAPQPVRKKKRERGMGIGL